MSSLFSTSFRPLSTPLGISTGLGLAASSFFVWGNFAAACMGPLHITKRASVARLRIPPGQALALWEAFYDLGIAYFGPTTVVAALAFGAAGRLSARPTRTLFYFATGAHLIVWPFTLLFIAPINRNLKAILRRVEARASSPSAVLQFENKQEESHADEQIARWRTVNAIRFSMGGSAWLAAVLAVLAREP